MNIHEYQAKELMKENGIPVLDGLTAGSPDDAVEVAKKLEGDFWVVKAQIHAGGRGKGGGVKLARSLDEVKKHAGAILGKNLVTPQTGPSGKKVETVLIERGCDIKHEYYAGMILDRTTGKLLLMASKEGGVDIEKVALESPDKIVRVHVDPAHGYTPFVGRKLVYKLGLPKELLKQGESFFHNLYKLYTKYDCTVAEINPLVSTTEGKLLALDAKLNFDDNALFRQKNIACLMDPNEESARELEASKYGLSYIALEGEIGCLVNGAGLAMGTMDIIKLSGGSPANFLDVGGGADKEAVEKAFSIILQDRHVKAILVNIFGGIMKCDIIAEGMISAIKSLGIKVPLVIRLEGTNVSVAKTMLNQSDLDIITADDLTEAAEKVVAAVKGV